MIGFVTQVCQNHDNSRLFFSIPTIQNPSHENDHKGISLFYEETEVLQKFHVLAGLLMWSYRIPFRISPSYQLYSFLYFSVSQLSRRKKAPSRSYSGEGFGSTNKTHGKGISASALPYKRTAPSWLKTSPQDVEENICKFAKKGLTPSQIGVILRDSHGIAQVRTVTGNQILRILKAHGLAPEIPEDLYHLIKKAVAIRKHLERNRKDKDSKFRLILVESRIHRLARYYKKTKKLPPVWKYESTTASTLVA
ncbi:hypothetical protein SADUNF_Sadunf14G0043800 [Salix dunnii]|uniref:Small ribosomal subunit protein uS15 N-terminal domain-containing protein n=1 Tax=Salix dunnii TaxID=1413687 RepID=A0A835MJH7_9ROSI|nr:hypothetical protein SADUNF_Sadunf14G0043800 [Salix dunnii]